MAKVIDQREYIEYSLVDYIDLIDVVDNKIFYENTVASVLKSNFIYDEIYSRQSIVDLKESLINFLNSLDKDLYCSFIFKKSKDFSELKSNHLKTNQTDDDVIKSLFQKRIEKLEDDIELNRLFSYELYVVIKKETDFDSNKLTGSEDSKQVIESVMSEIEETEDKVISYLSKTELDIKRLNKNDTFNFYASQINLVPVKKEEYKTKYDLIDSDLEIEKDCIQVNGKYVRAVTLKAGKEPEKVFPTIIKNIIVGSAAGTGQASSLNFEYDIVFNFKMLDKQSQKQQFQRQLNWNEKMKFGMMGQEDQDKSKNVENLQNLLKDMTSGRENVFRVELIILIKADSKKELVKNTDKMLSNFNQMKGARGYRETFANFNLYLASWPGNSDLNNFKSYKFRTSYLADLLPVYGPPDGFGRPLIMFRNRYNSITHIDPYNSKYKKKNAIVVGSTGSGKSVLINKINLSLLAFNPIITIIDKGGSYKKLASIFGGDHFEVSFDERGRPNYRINPFITPNENLKDMYWQSLIGAMVKEEDRPLSNNEKIIVEDTVRKLIKSNIEKPTITEACQAMKRLQYEKDEVLKRTKENKYRHLRRWTKGRKGELFDNKKGNLNLDNDILSIDLDGLDDFPELLKIVMFYISRVCKNKVEMAADRVKQFIFEEVWKLFMNDQGKELIKDFYRTIRKKGGTVYTASQSIEEWANNDIAPSILNNISMYYILEQGETDYSLMQKTFSLSDKEIKGIKNLNSIKGKYSEMFVNTPETSFFGRLILSPYEYWTTTTDENDNPVFERTLEKFDCRAGMAIEHLAEKYPNGVIRGRKNGFK